MVIATLTPYFMEGEREKKKRKTEKASHSRRKDEVLRLLLS